MAVTTTSAIKQTDFTKPGGTNDKSAISAAAQYYHIPFEILWGVYGIETGFGTNIKTSSAGAVGPFQFIPSTARSYAYPLRNDRTQFRSQAYSAAHYLSDLKNQYGSWDKALEHYSGGGYGQKKVLDTAKSKPISVEPNADSGFLGTGIGNPVGINFLPWGEALGKVLGNLLNPEWWLHALEVVAGITLIGMGLHAFGVGPTTSTITKAVKAV